MATTLLKGGTVYDGAGGAPREADVLITRDSIARVAPRLGVKADEIIEVRGAIVCPGFIDIANYADHYRTLFSDPAGTELVTRGITSIVVGHGGASLAPFAPRATALETWWGNPEAPAAHAATVREFFALLAGKMGVNIGTLAGYATLRETIAPAAARDLTEAESAWIGHAVVRAIGDGALGVSLNLEYPGTARVSPHEVRVAARAASRAGGMFALRLRDREEKLEECLAEALAVSEEAGTELLITDLEPYARERDAYRALLVRITKRSAEHRIHFTTSGTGAAAMPLALFLPRHFREPSWSAMRARLDEPGAREEIRAHLARYRDVALHIGMVADPSLKLFEGTPFSKWSLHEHLPFEDALLRLMMVTGLRAVVVAATGNPVLAAEFAAHDRALIASGEAATPSLESSAHLAFLAGASSVGALSLEQRIARMTGSPAKKLGLARRGLLCEGYRADLIVVEAGAVREAFVNGARAVWNGAPTGARGGAALTRMR